MSVTVIGPRWSLGLHQDSCPRISDLRGNGEGWWVNKAGSIFVIFGSLLTTRAQEQLKKTVVCKHSSFANDRILFLFRFYAASHQRFLEHSTKSWSKAARAQSQAPVLADHLHTVPHRATMRVWMRYLGLKKHLITRYVNLLHSGYGTLSRKRSTLTLWPLNDPLKDLIQPGRFYHPYWVTSICSTETPRPRMSHMCHLKHFSHRSPLSGFSRHCNCWAMFVCISWFRTSVAFEWLVKAAYWHQEVYHSCCTICTFDARDAALLSHMNVDQQDINFSWEPRKW